MIRIDRIFFATAVVTFGFLAASGNSRGYAASPSTPIRVGSEIEFPPYAYVDESGQAAGFSIDLIKSVADTMGLPLTTATGPWDSVWHELVAGSLDVLPIVAALPERKRFVDFSTPHTETFDAFFVRRGADPIPDMARAKGKEIVVMRSDASHHALLERKFQGNVILVATMPEGLSLVSSGKYDAFLGSKLIGSLAIKAHGLTGLVAGPPIPDYKRVFSFAIKKGNAELLEKLNQGLLIVKTNGEYDRIYDKWLTFDDPWRKFHKYMGPAVYIVIASLVAIGIWLTSLKVLVNKLRASEARYRALFNNMIDGFAFHRMVTDEEGNPVDYVFLEANESFEKLTGLQRNEILGKGAREVLPGIENDPADWIGNFGKVAFAGKQIRFEQYAAALGKWYSVSAYCPKKGYFATIFEDISARKQLENDLREAVEVRDDFLSIASHELKTPLTALCLQLQLLGRIVNIQPVDLRRIDAISSGAYQASQQLVRLIDDLLDITRIRAGKLTLDRREMDLRAALVQNMNTVLTEAQRQGGLVTLKADQPVIGVWDPSRINQIITNLLSNAVKYGDGKPIEVTVLADEKADCARLLVQDQGIGIPGEMQNKIFERFERAAAATQISGLGLGLYIVRQIVEAHGGLIRVESEPGRGALFVVDLPFRQAPYA